MTALPVESKDIELTKKVAKPPFERRYGKFSVSSDLIRCDWPNLVEALKDFLVIRAETMFSGVIEYVALSKHFEVVEDHIEPPRYQLRFKLEDGKPKLDTVTKE
jgi:hypothetical protein